LTLKLALQAESIFPPGVSALYTKVLTPVARLYLLKLVIMTWSDVMILMSVTFTDVTDVRPK
jgi:hypothetical protein